MARFVLDFAEMTEAERAAIRRWQKKLRFRAKSEASQITRPEMKKLYTIVFRVPMYGSELWNGELYPAVINQLYRMGWGFDPIHVTLMDERELWYIYVWRPDRKTGFEPDPGDYWGFNYLWTGSSPL